MSDELRVRLRAERDSGRRTVGGGIFCSDGTSKFWGSERIMELRNPDGNEAATLIEQQAETIARLTARIEAVIQVIERGHPRIVEGVPVEVLRTHDKCDHGPYGFEDCVGCYNEALRAALTPSLRG